MLNVSTHICPQHPQSPHSLCETGTWPKPFSILLWREKFNSLTRFLHFSYLYFYVIALFLLQNIRRYAVPCPLYPAVTSLQLSDFIFKLNEGESWSDWHCCDGNHLLKTGTSTFVTGLNSYLILNLLPWHLAITQRPVVTKLSQNLIWNLAH